MLSEPVRYWNGMGPTRSIRFASGFISVNALIVPSSIQSETDKHFSVVIITPINGRTFGCRRYLQITASLQNSWAAGQEKIPEGSSTTDPAPHFMVVDSRMQNLDSHRATPVSPFEHRRHPTVIHRECRGFIVEIHDLGRSRDILVMVTQPVQLIQSSCPFPYIRKTLFQDLNP